MPGMRLSAALVALPLIGANAMAQPSMPVEWPTLADPDAQQFEDPYRDLSQSQFESLMALARTQIALGGDLADGERDKLKQRALELSQELHAQGLEPEWILAQRDAVAERRERAAVSTNPTLEGASIELRGYLLVAAEVGFGERVAYLLPDRAVCMHLPAPVPNQLIRLDIEQLPEPLGACIATAVRGRLFSDESTVTVPILDHTVPMRSSWRLDVSEATTLGDLSAEDSHSANRLK